MKNKDFMRQLASFITDRLRDENLSVDGLSKSFFLSRSQLFRRTKAETGLSPSEFINEQRLLTAEKMLQKESDLPIQKVAERAGFRDAAYFSRLFRRRFGLAPSELRETIKKSGD